MKTNKTKKVVKPVFKVDLTNCVTVEDVIVEIALAKVEAGVAITRRELETIVEDEIDSAICDFVEELFDGHNAVVIDNNEFVPVDATFVEEEKKPSVFKRLWNKITGK